MRTETTTVWGSSRGFTLMELLVAMTLTSILMVMVTGHVLNVQQVYHDDVVRIQINSNLRSAMDIVAQNIRQAGENLESVFPALVLEDGGAGTGDTLKLRRNVVPEVLTVCADVSEGDSVINVSSAVLTESACLPANVAGLVTVFENERLESEDGTIRAYLLDDLTGAGEFVDFTSSTIGAGYSLTVSDVSRDYAALSSHVYLIEEFMFQLNTVEKKLEVYIDGVVEEPKPVAFSISAFQVVLQMSDSTTIGALSAADATYDWKDIRQVRVTLTAEQERKNRTFSTTMTAEYFPRNVLSN